MRRWIPWVPMLMFGSLVYWTVALNFGGLSLMRVSSYFLSMGGELSPYVVDDSYLEKDSFQPITVHLTGQDELGWRVTDDDSVTVDVVSDHDTARADQRGAGDRGGRADTGPGETAF